MLLRPLAVLLALGGLAAWPAAAEEPAAAGAASLAADLEARLHSPVAEVRRRADEALDGLEGAAARRLVQAWCASASPQLRAAACRLRGRLGASADVEALLQRLDAEDAIEGPAATDALLTLARSDRLGLEPPLPAEAALSARATRRLAAGLHERLGSAGQADVGWVLRLGEGVVAPLAYLLDAAPLTDPARGSALRLLGGIGGDGARKAVVLGGPQAWAADMEAWSEAVLALAPGPGLDEIGTWLDATVLQSEAAARLEPRRGPPPWARSRDAFCQVLARFAEGPRREPVLEVLRTSMRQRRGWANGRVSAARALLSLGEPTSDDLVLIVEAAVPPYTHRARAGATHDALAELLALVLPWRADGAVREAVQDVASRRALPDVHRTWCRYLLEGPEAEGLAEEATLLVAQMPPHTGRQQLGARLLDDLGVAPGPALEAALDSHDPWLRGWALGRLMGRGGGVAREAVERALADPDDGVLLVGAEGGVLDLAPEHVLRLVDRATFAANEATRRRTWQALARHVGPGASAGEESGRPAVGAGDERLDDRLRLRAAWRAP